MVDATNPRATSHPVHQGRAVDASFRSLHPRIMMLQNAHVRLDFLWKDIQTICIYAWILRQIIAKYRDMESNYTNRLRSGVTPSEVISHGHFVVKSETARENLDEIIRSQSFRFEPEHAAILAEAARVLGHYALPMALVTTKSDDAPPMILELIQ